MALRVEDYAPKLRNSKVERELATELRKLPETDRVQFINKLSQVPRCFGVAMLLAKKCLKETPSLESLLVHGLENGDASTVKYWIAAVVDGLGFRRVVRIVSARIATDPESVIRAEYHLRKWIPQSNNRDTEAFAVLHNKVMEMLHNDPTIETRVRPFKALMKKSI